MKKSPAELLAEATLAKGRRVLSGTSIAGQLVCQLREVRRSLNLRQADVQNALGVTNVSTIENGTACSIVYALKFARFFGRPVEELWQLKDDNEPTPPTV